MSLPMSRATVALRDRVTLDDLACDQLADPPLAAGTPRADGPFS